MGHDEYWDIRQYHSAVKIRDAGVNLMFFSGNSVCWVTPFKPSSDGRPNRVIFRSGPYGGTYKWAEDRIRTNGPFPERGPDEGYLIGGEFSAGQWRRRLDLRQAGALGLRGNRHEAGRASAGPGRLGVPRRPAHGPAGTGDRCPRYRFHRRDHTSPWTATIYPGPKGNFVFNAATIFWAQGMSTPPGHMLPWSHWNRPHGSDPRVQQITHNLLERAGCRP